MIAMAKFTSPKMFVRLDNNARTKHASRHHRHDAHLSWPHFPKIKWTWVENLIQINIRIIW